MREPLLGRSQADFLVLKDQTHLIIETQLVLSKIKDIYYIFFLDLDLVGHRLEPMQGLKIETLQRTNSKTLVLYFTMQHHRRAIRTVIIA